jgi:hypothetical protein
MVCESIEAAVAPARPVGVAADVPAAWRCLPGRSGPVLTLVNTARIEVRGARREHAPATRQEARP